MAKLDIVINEPTKDQDTQNKQLFVCLQNIFSWSNNILTQICLDFKEGLGTSDKSTTNTNYESIPDYSKSVSVKNPVCLINLNLQLRGSGFIGIYINGVLVSEVPFSNLNFSPIIHSYYYTFKVGTNQVDIKWKANSGTIVKACSKTNPGFNAFQIISFNS